MINIKIFWNVIKACNWRGNVDESKENLLNYCEKNNITAEDVEKQFASIVTDICSETLKRTQVNKPVWSQGIAHGADDDHLMDMPSTLITKGNAALQDYLNGGLITWQSVEGFNYIFHKEEEIAVSEGFTRIEVCRKKDGFVVMMFSEEQLFEEFKGKDDVRHKILSGHIREPFDFEMNNPNALWGRPKDKYFLADVKIVGERQEQWLVGTKDGCW